MKSHILHPLGFTMSFLTAALSLFIQDEASSKALKGVSLLSFYFGTLWLYEEGQLKKKSDKNYYTLSNFLSSFWPGSKQRRSVETPDLSDLEVTGIPRLNKG